MSRRRANKVSPSRRRSGARPRFDNRVEHLLAAIEERLAGPLPVRDGESLSDDALARVAERIYQARRHRARYLNAELLGEPAWDMLLELFAARVRGQKVRTSSICIASVVPSTTALRWLDELEKRGLIERVAEDGDRRVRLVRLSDHGMRMMRQYLDDGVHAGELPAGGYMSRPRRGT